MYLLSLFTVSILPALFANAITINIVEEKFNNALSRSDPTGPRYVAVGCWSDKDSPRTLTPGNENDSHMTTEACFSICSLQNQAYFGTEDGIY